MELLRDGAGLLEGGASFPEGTKQLILMT